MDLPIRRITPSDVQNEIKTLNNAKSLGYDNIDSKILKSLPNIPIIFRTTIYNSILRLNYFPLQWKYAKSIMVLKPNKPENVILLSTFSKIFKNLFLKRKEKIIPEYQFGFRHHHGIA